MEAADSPEPRLDAEPHERAPQIPARELAASSLAQALRPEEAPVESRAEAAPTEVTVRVQSERVERVRPEIRSASASAEVVRATPHHRPLEPVELLPQVRKAIVELHTLGGEVRVRLDPPELGAMRVTVQRHEGALHATIQVAHSEVRDALHRHAEDLRNALAERGLQIAECQVELSAESGQERRLWWNRPETPLPARWPAPDPPPWVRPLVGQLALLTPRLNPSLGLNYVA